MKSRNNRISLPHCDPSFRAKGSVLYWLLHTNVWTLTSLLLGLYLCLAIMFVVIYSLIPEGLACSYDPNRLISWDERLHFSFTTQATVGYGDFYPKGLGRWCAAAQGMLGIFLNSSLIGIIVFRLLRVEHQIRFPSRCCFDPKESTFVFRFLNGGAEDLIQINIRVMLIRYLTKQEDSFITTRGYTLALNGEMVSMAIPSGLLVAFRTKKANYSGVPLTEPTELSPLHLRAKDALEIQISGMIAGSGTGVLAVQKYPIEDVQCGLYETADNNYDLLDKINETTNEYCRQCSLQPRCELTLARIVRSTDDPTSQQETESSRIS
ncbi:MAG: potassium channel family protein [Chthoniobacter sp.]